MNAGVSLPRVDKAELECLCFFLFRCSPPPPSLKKVLYMHVVGPQLDQVVAKLTCTNDCNLE